MKIRGPRIKFSIPKRILLYAFSFLTFMAHMCSSKNIFYRLTNRTSFYSRYHPVQEVLDRMNHVMTQKCPQGASQEILRTYQGYPIQLFRVGVTSPKNPRRILITAGMHGRERSTSLIACYFLEAMCENMKKKISVPPLHEVEVLVIPVSNPDGQEKARLVKASHRKNLRPGEGDISPCDNGGVDINRNFPRFWNLGNGTSQDPCSDVYSGPYPLSEPESQSIAKVVRNNCGIMAHVDLHSFGQLILRGTAFKHLSLNGISANTIRKQYTLARAMRMAIRKSKGTDMVDVDAFLATNRLTNRAPGGTLMDFMLGLNIPSISIEIGPKMTAKNRLYGFTTAPESLLDVVKELYEGLSVSVLAASKIYHLPVYSDEEIGTVLP